MRRLFLFITLLAGLTQATSICDLSETRAAQIRSLAMTNLQLRGYETELGGNVTFKPVCHKDSPTCFGDNVSSPYGRYLLRTPLFDNIPLPVYQLRPAEAIIFYGCSAPEARYMGIQSYAFMTNFVEVFASLGDSINIEVVNTTKGGSAPFGREMLVVTTGDQRTARDVIAAFVAAGASPDAVNIDQLPDPAVLGLQPIGLGNGHTIFTTLHRVASPANETEFLTYSQQNWPVLRVYPRQAPTPAQVTFPPKPLLTRDNTHTEDYLKTSFATLLDNVRLTFTKLSPDSVLVSTDTLPPLNIEGRECIKELRNCLGDTRDTIYEDGNEPLLQEFRAALSKLYPHRKQTPALSPSGPSWNLKNDSRDFLVIVGVLHAQTKPVRKATYTNVVVYYEARKMGVLALMDDVLKGSASHFNVTNAEQMYVQKFSRICKTSEPFCAQVPFDFPGVPDGRNCTLVERVYLQPGTHCSPDGRSVLHPVVFHFAPKDSLV